MQTTPIDALAETEQCVVCGDQADGFHYGVRSCRGCNAFFRRSITYDMTFTCRRGGKCPVDKNARCACRACRLAKCFSVGMDRRAVQPKKEPAGGVVDPGDTSPMESSRKFSSMFVPALPPSPPPNSGVISRLCYDFSEQKKRRRYLLCGSLVEILNESTDNTLKGPACGDDYIKLFQVQMVLMFEWVEKLDEFRRLMDSSDKTKLLRAFALRYLLLDNLFHTLELGYSDRVILVNNSFIKPGDYPSFDPNETADATQVKLLMYGNESSQLINDLLLPLHNLKISVGELMCLRIIMLWNSGPIGLSPHGCSVAHEASNAVIKELHNYYELEGVRDIQQRIGNILILLPIITKHVQLLYNTVKLIPCFGQMNEWDSFMDDLLKGF
ncbi:unnamed protein product [Auanema sp. JU1783]|nr:unnamed protein product [Auanema sp. JU1783]